jgi:hypothetical protein
MTERVFGVYLGGLRARAGSGGGVGLGAGGELEE